MSEVLQAFRLSPQQARLHALAAAFPDVPLGAVAHKEFMKQLASDPNIAATFANAQAGEPMPNVAAMGKFWSAMATSLSNVTSGRQPVDKALDAAAKRIVK